MPIALSKPHNAVRRIWPIASYHTSPLALFFFCIPQLSPLCVRFLCMRPFFNLTIEVVTLFLRGCWVCFLLPIFTRIGHEYHGLLSLCDGVHGLDLGLYSHPKESWGNGVRTRVNSKGKSPSTSKILLRGGSNPRRGIKRDLEPSTLPTSYSAPPPPHTPLTPSSSSESEHYAMLIRKESVRQR